MAETRHKIHICDDWLTAELPDLQTVHSLSNQLRDDGQWIEVVGGLGSIAVQFDPALQNPEEALALLEQQLELPPLTLASEVPDITLPVCYHPDFGTDNDLVANALNIEPSSIADWHSHLKFTVAMLGFMPGFSYLQCDGAIPDIGRLRQPRQKVAAGSIGIIGDQSCIYSFDSPGGWPIIGKTPSTLFNQLNQPPALLSAGQFVRFSPITKTEFEKLL